MILSRYSISTKFIITTESTPKVLPVFLVNKAGKHIRSTSPNNTIKILNFINFHSNKKIENTIKVLSVVY